MSFFNLTSLGYNNTIKRYKNEKEFTNYKNEEEKKSREKLNSSWLVLTEKKTKHKRDPKEPNQHYTRSLVTSQEISWWTKDNPIQENLPWTQVEKRVFPKSEMTS
jgi:hypothetical protein